MLCSYVILSGFEYPLSVGTLHALARDDASVAGWRMPEFNAELGIPDPISSLLDAVSREMLARVQTLPLCWRESEQNDCLDLTVLVPGLMPRCLSLLL